MSQDAERAELPPDRVTTLWRRVKEHRVAQWAIAYVATEIKRAATNASSFPPRVWDDWPLNATHTSSARRDPLKVLVLNRVTRSRSNGRPMPLRTRARETWRP
jgi:hypothetical protein